MITKTHKNVNDNSTFIAEIQKNTTEVVRVSLGTYRGNDLLDIRVYFRDDNGEYMPSRKGVCLRVNAITELIKAIEIAEKKVKLTGNEE